MIVIREPTLQDEEKFLSAMHRSVQLHYLWVKAPQTSEEFQTYIKKSQQENQKSLLVLKNNEIAGVFNVSEIVRGYFQNAFLGFYAISGFENKGVMSVGLKLVLKYFFEELKLHRIEANIQPENIQSIHLVKKNKFRYEGFSPRYLKINYEYWADNPDKTRLFFVKGMPPYGEKRTHHVHIVELDSHHWRDKIAFRDLLRAHPDVAKEYEILKNDLAKRYRYDREKYTDEKADFIKKILK